MKFEIGNKVSVKIENFSEDEIGIVIGRQEHEPRSQNLYKIHFINENMYKFRNRWIVQEKDLKLITKETETKYLIRSVAKMMEEIILKEEMKLKMIEIDPFGEENWI